MARRPPPSRNSRAAAILWLAAAVLAGSLTGCDSAPAPSETGLPLGDPSVAWQARPFRVDELVLAAALASCRNGGIPADVRPVLADARGADRMTLLFESPDRKTSASCSTLRSVDGSWQATSSSASSGSQAPDRPGPNDVQVGMEVEGGGTMNGLTAPGRSIASGLVGVNVAGILLVVAGRPITATVGNGWFSAWWPTGDRATQVTAVGADGQPLPPSAPTPR